jgi:hypothetical protein
MSQMTGREDLREAVGETKINAILGNHFTGFML